VAQSVGQSNPGFTGSGTIVTIKFNVVGTGDAGLNLQTDLADHPAAGQNANNIDHKDTASSVTAIAAGSSSSPNSSNTPGSSPTVPEFSGTIITVILISIIITATVVATKKRK